MKLFTNYNMILYISILTILLSLAKTENIFAIKRP